MFGAGDIAALAGLWHDLGKYRPSFQRYIRGAHGLEKSHKLAGAALALRMRTGIGDLIALAISGHHGGIPSLCGAGSSLDARRTDAECELAEAVAAGAPADILAQLPPTSWNGRPNVVAPEDVVVLRELLTRFVFSALVDADYRDTAAFYDPASEARRATAAASHHSMAELRDLLDAHLNILAGKAEETPVNRQRSSILASCRAAAEQPPGIFDLTVPTGGGKTLAAMSFALRHAARHGKRRVIVVLPFTAIIEQNARVYAGILGEDQVLEHHGAYDGESERIAAWCRQHGLARAEHTRRHKLVAENWDAPVIVTTSVQFLESLHAHEPGRCRKLHNLADAVVILDEAQSIPAHLLDATLDTLRGLVRAFGVSLVCCTATQPALHARTDAQGRHRPGLGAPVPIIAEPGPLFAALDRVLVTWPDDLGTVLPWGNLAEQLRAEPQALAVVHRRQDAWELARLVGEDCLHLSALMLPDHRHRVLTDIRQRLKDRKTCRVVATQLIEAGVDVDFPVVFRALAGLDSLAQAAGRCNREGRLGPRGGRFTVFVAPSSPPPGILARAAEVTKTMLRAGPLDLADPQLYPRFYARLYDSSATDARGLGELRIQRDFPQIAERYKLIDDGGQIPVVVRWSGLGPATLAAIDRLAAGFADSEAFRLVRRASVQVPRSVATAWLVDHVLRLARNHPIPILSLADWPDRYDTTYGLRIWDEPSLSTEQLIL